jgi:hypothetical protein
VNGFAPTYVRIIRIVLCMIYTHGQVYQLLRGRTPSRQCFAGRTRLQAFVLVEAAHRRSTDINFNFALYRQNSAGKENIAEEITRQGSSAIAINASSTFTMLSRKLTFVARTLARHFMMVSSLAQRPMQRTRECSLLTTLWSAPKVSIISHSFAQRLTLEL